MHLALPIPITLNFLHPTHLMLCQSFAQFVVLFRALGWFSSLSEPHSEMPSVMFKWHLHTAHFQVIGKYEAIKEI